MIARTGAVIALAGLAAGFSVLPAQPDVRAADAITFSEHVASISYDNSSENPRNPNAPRRRVSWGEQSTDEMGSVNLQVVAADETELPRLRQAYIEPLRDRALASPDLGRFLRWLNRGRGRRGRG